MSTIKSSALASTAEGYVRHCSGAIALQAGPHERPAWLSDRDDPFVDLLIDPTRTEDARAYAAAFYQEEKRSRRRLTVGLLATAAVAAILCAAAVIFTSPILGLVGLGGGALLASQITGSYQHERTDRRRIVQWQPWARSSLALSGYLVTTPDRQSLWEAAGHQLMRDALQKEIIRLCKRRNTPLPSPHRDAELQHLFERDDALREQIIALCDPHPLPDLTAKP